MRAKTRQCIFYLYLLIFLVTGPSLALYTAGYRLDFKTWRWGRVGVLVAESKPDNADVYLNNELYKNKTPVRINALFPQDYQIKIVKEDYHLWQKTVAVKPNATTFLQ